ncbi:MAG: hypothetical protein ABS880_06265, partial [Psychrobacter alimentarius]
DDIKGRKITSLGHRKIARPVHPVIDPRGRDAYWLSLRKAPPQVLTDNENVSLLAKDNLNQKDQSLAIPWTDDEAVAAGYISLSPVRLHHTPDAALDRLLALSL